MGPLVVSHSAERPTLSCSSFAITERDVNAMATAKAPFKLWFKFASNLMGRPREPKNRLLRNDILGLFSIDPGVFTFLSLRQ